MTLVFVVGGLALTGPAGAVVFSNPTPIQTDVVFLCEPYKTSPLYPSPITVSGLSGTITDVNVTLHDFAAQDRDPATGGVAGFAEDADILLEAPNGTNLMLMSDVGGTNGGARFNISGVDITIDDSAPESLPADTPFASNTSVTGRPTDDDDDVGEVSTIPGPDVFFNPPVCDPPGEEEGPQPDPYEFTGPTASGNTTLAAFNGIDPNGTWKLWMVDDYGGPELVALDGGWSIDITVSGPSLCSKPTITGTPGVDNLVGTEGPDVIAGLGGNDMIDGRGGDDEICGGDGTDSIAGGYGNDTISGGEGGDRLSGTWGNDTLQGDGGDDFLAGGTGTDTCAGGTGLNSFSSCETQQGA